jgi:hypothetical protein
MNKLEKIARTTVFGIFFTSWLYICISVAHVVIDSDLDKPKNRSNCISYYVCIHIGHGSI